MDENHRIYGSVIRRERIKKGIEQKVLCRGVCVPSYLSKIEHGTAQPDMAIIYALFDRLGIKYESDPETLSRLKAAISDEYERTLYNMPPDSSTELLERHRDGVMASFLAPDHLVIRGLSDENTVPELDAMSDCLTARQAAYLGLLRWKFGASEDIRALRGACCIINDSFSLNFYAEACYVTADYTAVINLEDEIVSRAVAEGNTYQLANFFALKGSAYSCLFLEDMMMVYYKRAISLLQNTGWRDGLAGLYYNIGATMLSLRHYDEAERYLDLAEDSRNGTLLLHKRALLAIRRGDKEKGRELIAGMRRMLDEDSGAKGADYLRAEEAEWELREDFLADSGYLALLDRLIAELKRDYHFGHISFYQDVYLAACTRQRQYRRALVFQQMISSRAVKNIT